MMLTSEIVQRQFDEISLKLVKQNKKLRVSKIIDREGITRVYSLVFFNQTHTFPTELNSVFKEILEGNFIGQTFENHKVKFTRKPLATFMLKTKSSIGLNFFLTEDPIKAQFIETKFCWQNTIYDYAKIFEFYHPSLKIKLCANTTNEDFNIILSLLSPYISPNEIKEYEHLQ